MQAESERGGVREAAAEAGPTGEPTLLAKLLAARAALNGEKARQAEDERREVAELRASNAELRADVKDLRDSVKELCAGFKELRTNVTELSADFTVLAQCLERHGLSVSSELRRARCVRAGLRLDNVLANHARPILAAAGQPAWSASRRASKSVQLSAEAVQEERIFVVGGCIQEQELGNYNDDHLLKTAESFDAPNNHWQALPSNFKRAGHTGAVLCGYLYICGGGGTLARNVVRLNPARWRWESVSPMAKRRTNAAAAVARNCLFVCGGQDGDNTWRCVERFNPVMGRTARDCWDAAPMMSTCRRKCAAVALRDEVFVCGGACQSGHAPDPLDTAEALTSCADAWEALPKMTLARRGHAAAVCSGKVYVTAGFCFGVGSSNSLEVYDPSVHAWELASLSMVRPLHSHTLVALAGALYVIGGLQHLGVGAGATREVQRLDLAGSVWEEQASMESERESFVAVKITLGPTRAS